MINIKKHFTHNFFLIIKIKFLNDSQPIFSLSSNITHFHNKKDYNKVGLGESNLAQYYEIV